MSRNICSAVFSTPLRYMPRPFEIVHRDDVENSILLILDKLKKLEPEKLSLARSIPFYTETQLNKKTNGS